MHSDLARTALQQGDFKPDAIVATAPEEEARRKKPAEGRLTVEDLP